MVDVLTKEAVAGASVSLSARESPATPSWHARTGADGAFLVGAPRTGACTIAASAPGYASNAFDLDPAAGPVVVELAPDPSASIAGRVLDPDGHPAPWARVRLESPEWRSPADAWVRTEQGTVADASGRFALRGIRSIEDHAVVAELEGFAPARLDGIALAAPRRIEGLELRLRRGATIRGRIVEEGGAPISGAYVLAEAGSPGKEAVGPSGGKEPRRVWADCAPDGTYALRHIEPGTWLLSPEAPGRHDLAGREVEVADGEEIAVDWTFPLGETVRGMVIDDAGRPLGRVSVWLAAAGLESPAGASTRPDGRFEFRGIARGSVSIAASRHPFRADERTLEVPGPDVVLRLGRPARIRGRIEAPGLVRFGPLSEVEIGARDEATGSRFEVDRTGRFRVTVEPGDRWLATDVPGFARAWVELRLEPGAEEDVVLPIEPGGSLAGLVIEGGSGRAAAHARVHVVAAGGRRPPEHLWAASTDGSGEWRIDGLPAGPVRLQVEDRMDARARVHVHGVVVVAGQTTGVNIPLREGTGVMGRVERDGRPVPGARVEVRPSDGSPATVLTTEGDGGFAAANVTPGTYRLVASEPISVAGGDGAPAAWTVTVRDGAYEWTLLELSPAEGE